MNGFFLLGFLQIKTYPSLAALERERNPLNKRVQRKFESVHAGKWEKRIWTLMNSDGRGRLYLGWIIGTAMNIYMLGIWSIKDSYV